jgi:hypothetical protein
MLGHLKSRRFCMEAGITEPEESKEAYWRRTLQQWRDSGLKACDFQRRNNLNKHAFIYWKLKLMGTEKRPTLVPVKMPTVARGAASPSRIRLRVGERFTVELTEGFDVQTLREVLAVLQESVP